MIRDCDYILDKRDRFWIAKYFENGRVYANLVFVPDEKGNRYNKMTGKFYKKVVKDNQDIKEFGVDEIKILFKPDEFFKNNYKNLIGVWKGIADSLIKVGVRKEDVGIFGSYLIGFDIVKDVDFVIYGSKNCRRVKSGIETLRREVGAEGISQEHIDYQVDKYCGFFSRENDFKRMLSNKWSSLQIRKGILSTLRFVYKDNELPEDLGVRKGFGKTIEGIVEEDFGTNFVPRIFYVGERCGKRVRVLTYFWAFQSCVKKGQKVRVSGDFCKENNTIYLSKPENWIKIAN